MGTAMMATASLLCVAFVALVAFSVPSASAVRFMEMIVRTGDAIQSEDDVDFLISQAIRTHIEGTPHSVFGAFSFHSIRECVGTHRRARHGNVRHFGAYERR
jgi:hypothetical protein